MLEFLWQATLGLYEGSELIATSTVTKGFRCNKKGVSIFDLSFEVQKEIDKIMADLYADLEEEEFARHFEQSRHFEQFGGIAGKKLVLLATSLTQVIL